MKPPAFPPPPDVVGAPKERPVLRCAWPGRAIRDGRIPGKLAAPLYLQAAAAASFFQAFGFPLAAEDLLEANWDFCGGTVRFRLSRTPAAVARQRSGGAPSEALGEFLD